MKYLLILLTSFCFGQFNPVQFYHHGRGNYLIYSQEFNNPYWSKALAVTNSATVISNAITAPDGSMTADKLYNNLAGSSVCGIIELRYRVVISKSYAFSIYAKAGSSGFLQITGRDTGFGASNTYSYATFDLTNGTVGAVGVGMTARIQLDNNGWYRCVLVGTTTSRATGIMGIYVVPARTSGRFQNSNYLDEVYIWGAKIEEGTVATNYKNEFTQVIYTGASPL